MKIKEKGYLGIIKEKIPYVFQYNKIDLKRVALSKKLLKKYDCVLLVTDHAKVNYAMVRQSSRLIFDTRNVYKKDFPNVERL